LAGVAACASEAQAKIKQKTRMNRIQHLMRPGRTIVWVSPFYERVWFPSQAWHQRQTLRLTQRPSGDLEPPLNTGLTDDRR
jgi:hypothetical protein